MKTIKIETDYFEHLSNCLANQKFMGYVNADGMSLGKKKVKSIQTKTQKTIDLAWRKGMDLLVNQGRKIN